MLVADSLLLLLVVGFLLTTAVAMVPVLAALRYRVLFGGLTAAAYFGASFPGFVLVCAAAFLAAQALSRQPDRAWRWRLALAAITVVSVLFVAGRAAGWQDVLLPLGPTAFVLYALDMWLLLRLVTLLWEVGSGRQRAPGAAQFAAWVAFPLTLAGPLVRYSEWPDRPEPDRHLYARAWWWRGIVEGAAKMTAGRALGLLPAVVPADLPHAPIVTGLLLVFLVGPVGFYLIFAGYFQLVQQLSLVVGVRVPDSFNWALGRENISAFWANWNMTAVRVFRDYLYFNRWGMRTHNPYLNVIVLFTLVGLWHDVHAYWILWGLLHGLLFCAYLVWKRISVSMDLPLRGTAAARLASRVLTYVAVCAAWYLPSKILERLGAL
ncbi:MAG TPA: MBOAT family O-acyltransferase [Vicinamibacterales bacterium]|nr:MBOAT family O-acyltransferase [Vicinamibacterales bacterium]